MKIILSIDTTSNELIRVGLIVDNVSSNIQQKLNKQKAQVVLSIIETLLAHKKLNLNDISIIKVNPGPGSFTGIRVGLTVANTLGYLLKIPVNDQPAGTPAEPVYT